MNEPVTRSPENRLDFEGIIQEFNTCEFARLLGMELTALWSGGARVVMDTEGKRNLNGVAHGGAVFALADQAFGIAANAEGIREVAVTAHIHYLAPGTGKLEAVAERVSVPGATSVYRVVVTDGERVVAEFDGIGIKV